MMPGDRGSQKSLSLGASALVELDDAPISIFEIISKKWHMTLKVVNIWSFFQVGEILAQFQVL
jgi:hypothetical protein